MVLIQKGKGLADAVSEGGALGGFFFPFVSVCDQLPK